jgi:predicted Zn-dependent protease with MMP-like domain
MTRIVGVRRSARGHAAASRPHLIHPDLASESLDYSMNRREFEDIVRETIERLPEEFLNALENIAIVVQEEPDQEDWESEERDPDGGELLGLYYGTPLNERGSGYSGLPDRIEIYRGPILRTCDSTAEIVAEIRRTVIHELGHHMGLSDDDMPY